MAELPVRTDPVREVAIATREAVVDPVDDRQPALAVAVAESLSYWLPAVLAGAGGAVVMVVVLGLIWLAR